ncbi:119_t:CDS:2, partial [Paraglomus brasilianum]
MINEHEAAIVRTTAEVITATFTTMSVAKPTPVQIPAAPYTLFAVEQNPNAFSAILKLSDPSASSNFTQDISISPLSLTVSYETPYRVRVCISDREEKRWRVPQSVVEVDGPHDNNKEFRYKFKYNVHEGETFAGFSVSRQKPREVLVKKTNHESDSCSGKALFDCINEKFVFKDQYIEITTKLGKDSNIYGLGEIVGPLKKKAGDRLTFWARDAQNPVGENIYGSHPFYIELRDGMAHGV